MRCTAYRKGDHVSDTQTEYSTRLYMKDGKLMMGDGEWKTRETALTPYVSYDAYSFGKRKLLS